MLLAHDPTGKAEIANDKSKDLSNFWRVLVGGDALAAFVDMMTRRPFSRPLWQAAIEVLQFKTGVAWKDWPVNVQVLRATAYFILARQSMAGRFGKDPVFAPITQTRLRSMMNEQVSAWWGAIGKLPEVHARLSRVLIECQDAIKLLSKWDKPRVLVYLDPPWMRETRAAKDVYDEETTEEWHRKLLELICSYENAFVCISGRHCPLYDFALARWNRHEITHKSSAGGGKTKKEMSHTVWTNY